MCERCLATDVKVGDELFFGGYLEPVRVVSIERSFVGDRVTYWLETADRGRAILVEGDGLLYATNRCVEDVLRERLDSMIGGGDVRVREGNYTLTWYDELLDLYPRPGKWVLRGGSCVVALNIEDVETVDDRNRIIYVYDGWFAANSDS